MQLTVNYDLKHQPFSVGDPITTAVGAAIVAQERGCESIHFVFTYDPSQPVISTYRGITADNLRDEMRSRGIMEAPAVVPGVRSVGVMSHQEFNGASWDSIWPEPDAPYLFYRLNDEIIGGHFRKTGTVPQLRTGRERPYFGPYVSVNLRRSDIQPERNSNWSAWVAFMFRHPETTFQVIGDVDVTGAQRSGAHLLDDLAVIEHAEFHMGTISGPCEMARFGSKPYAVFGPMRGEKERSMTSWADNRWIWGKTGQRWIAGDETPEAIEAEYQRLVGKQWTIAA